MQHPQTLQLVRLLERIEHLDGLREIQTEGTPVTRTLAPMAAPLRGKLDAQPQHRINPQRLAPLHHQLQLRRHLQHQHYIQSQLLGLQRQIDELGILVAIADQQRLAVMHERQRRQQLGLAAHFQTIMVLPPILGHLLHHLLLLVHLDRINPTVPPLVPLVPDLLPEGLVQFPDARIQQIRKPEERRQMEIPVLLQQALDDLHQTHLGIVTVALQPHGGFPIAVHPEKPMTP